MLKSGFWGYLESILLETRGCGSWPIDGPLVLRLTVACKFGRDARCSALDQLHRLRVGLETERERERERELKDGEKNGQDKEREINAKRVCTMVCPRPPIA